MAIGGILTSRNHYNQRVSGLWPTSFASLPITQWISTFGDSALEQFWSVKLDSSGNVFVCGVSASSGTNDIGKN